MAEPGPGTPEQQLADPGGGLAASQLAAVARVARIASEDLQLDPMLQRIVDSLQQQFGWEFIACVLVLAEEGRFECRAVHSDASTDIHVGYTRPLGSGVVGQVAASGRTLDIEDTAGIEDFIDTLDGTRSELCVPVVHHGVVVAVLNVESRRPAAFRGQRLLLETVAEQLAGVIAAARLHEELERRAELFETAAGLTRSVLEAGSLALGLQKVVDVLQQRFGTLLVTLLLVERAHDEAPRLRIAARAGRASFPPPGESLWPSGRGVIGRAFRSGRVEYVPDVRADPDYVEDHREVGSELVVPIRLRGELLGLFALESRGSQAFARGNRAVLASLADHIAGAVELAAAENQRAEMNRLLAERQRQLESLNARLREANAALQLLSHRDGLTGVLNRRGFDRLLERAWREAAEQGGNLGLLLIDIDHFKPYNDDCGHPAGDACLKRVASALQQVLEAHGDRLARYGGEEFAAVVTEADPGQLAALAERARASVQSLAIPHRHAMAGVVTVSCGAARRRAEASRSPDLLVQAADAALYGAKRAGRNCSLVDAGLPVA